MAIFVITSNLVSRHHACKQSVQARDLLLKHRALHFQCLSFLLGFSRLKIGLFPQRFRHLMLHEGTA
jgi:hypothetical protein